MQEHVISLVKKYWDCFCKDGAKRTILGYELSIETGNAKPVFCRKPQYGPYESNIIMEKVRDLLGNQWIERYRRPLDGSIVLTPKPHE